MKLLYLLLILLTIGCTAQLINIQNETSAADFALNNKDFSNFLIAKSITNKTLIEIEYVNAEEKSKPLLDELNNAYVYLQNSGQNKNLMLSYMKQLQNNIDVINQAGDYWSVTVSENKCSMYFAKNGTVLSYSFINGISQEVRFYCKS